MFKSAVGGLSSVIGKQSDNAVEKGDDQSEEAQRGRSDGCRIFCGLEGFCVSQHPDLLLL